MNKPFYPEKIHTILEELKLEAHMEAFSYGQKLPKSSDAKYWDEAQENAEKINTIVSRLCEAVRIQIHDTGWKGLTGIFSRFKP